MSQELPGERIEALRDDDVAAMVLHGMGCGSLARHHPGACLDRLAREVQRLRAAIRAHRDQRGDDRCHLDDAALYAALPEGDTRPAYSVERCAAALKADRVVEARAVQRFIDTGALKTRPDGAVGLGAFLGFLAAQGWTREECRGVASRLEAGPAPEGTFARYVERVLAGEDES